MNQTFAYTRLYLVPTQGKQRIIDVPSTELVLSDGRFMSPSVAPTVTLTKAPTRSVYETFEQDQTQLGLITSQSVELKVCFREPSDLQEYQDGDVVEAFDPTDGQCVCGITCAGTKLSYAQVYNVPPIV